MDGQNLVDEACHKAAATLNGLKSPFLLVLARPSPSTNNVHIAIKKEEKTFSQGKAQPSLDAAATPKLDDSPISESFSSQMANDVSPKDNCVDSDEDLAWISNGPMYASCETCDVPVTDVFSRILGFDYTAKAIYLSADMVEGSGLQMAMMTLNEQTTAVVVGAVSPLSHAASAGLQVGDVLLALNDTQ